MPKLYKLFILLFLCSAAILPQEKMLLITYGPNAPTSEGDPDFKQILFFSVPQSTAGNLHLRIYDADCGDNNDVSVAGFDTKTKFSLYGKDGAYSAISNKGAFPPEDAIRSGTLLKAEEYGVDPFLDNKWHNFADFLPSDGELIDGNYYFKVVVEGISGNDGNIFDITVSTQSKQNIEPAGLNLFSFVPTLRIPRRGVMGEIRFMVPQNMTSVTVYNFDLANGEIGVETPYRSKLMTKASNQDEWASSSVQLENNETGKINAVRVEGGTEMPNDLSVYVSSENGTLLPLILPAYIWVPNSRPVAEYTTTVLSDCYTVVFDGSNSSDKNGDLLDFLWELPDGTKLTGARVTHTFKAFGTYDAKLIVTDRSGQIGNGTVKNFSFKINEPPVSVAGSNMVIAPGDEVNFDGSASNDKDGRIVKYSWDMGDGAKYDGVKVKHKYSKPGIFTVTLKVEDDSNSPCNFHSSSLTVTVNSKPVAAAGNDMIAAVDEQISFNAGLSYDTDGEISKFDWNFGDGNTSSGEKVSHKYSKPGKYSVTLTVIDNTGASNNQATSQLVVTVNDKPDADAGSIRVVAVGERVNFDGSKSVDRDGQIIKYDWDFGDGGSGTGVKPEYIYKQPGKYTVKLTVTDNSNSKSSTNFDTATVIVNFPPVAVAGEDMLLTSSEARFDGSKSSDKDGVLTAYLWEFGDGNTSNEIKPFHFYKKPGTYKVKLTVTDNTSVSSNKTSDELTVIINALPVAKAKSVSVAAPGETINFDASESSDPDGSIAKYEWDFGDGNTAQGKSVTHKFTLPGLYTIKLKVADNTGHENAVDYTYLTVKVNSTPLAKAGNSIIAAPGDKIVLDASGSFDLDGEITKYSWNFSDKSPGINSERAERVFEREGIYTAYLTVTDNSGASNNTANDRIEIRINSMPVAKAGENIFSCSNTIFFDGSLSADPDGDGLTYVWDFGDGSPKLSGLKVSHTYQKSGSYPVILSVNDGTGTKNSSSETTITVIINERPVANAGLDKTICSGDLVLFDGSDSFDPEGGLLKYLWDFGDGTKAEGVSPAKKYNTPGNYTVTLTVQDESGLDCNTNSSQISVVVVESPMAVAGVDQIVCTNSLVFFDGSKSTDFDGVVNSFSWDFGDGNSGGGEKPTHVFSKPGTYRVVLTITGDQIGDCDNSSTDEITVTVIEGPKANFVFDKKAPVNSAVQFDASSSDGRGAGISKYVWDFGDGTTGEGEKVSKIYEKHGQYFVTLTVSVESNNECNSATIKDYIIINASPVAVIGDVKTAGPFESIVFSGIKSSDPDGIITRYNWDFGDGAKATGVEVNHSYSKPGTYNAVLTVTDNFSLSNSTGSQQITVTINETPVPVISSPFSACAGENVEFSGELSKDSDGKIMSYFWSFSDGFTDEGEKISKSFLIPGIYTVTLRIDDGSKAANSTGLISKEIKINTPPYANGGADRVVCAGEPVMFDASLSNDIDGDSLTYNWNMGDGGIYNSKVINHTFKGEGNYKVLLSVNDNSKAACAISIDTINVKVNRAPVAPQAKAISGFTGGAHDAITFDASSAKDADGDPLSYDWDFGDGSKGSGKIVSHYFKTAGNYKVTLTINDNSGLKCGEVKTVYDVTIVKR